MRSSNSAQSNPYELLERSWSSGYVPFVLFTFISIWGYVDSEVSVLRLQFVLVFVNWLLRARQTFELIAILPVFAILQLILAPSELRNSTNVFLAYSPQNIEEYISFALPLVTAFCLPYFIRTPSRQFKVDIIVEAEVRKKIQRLIVLGLVAELMMFEVSNVPIVGPLLFYFTLLWKVSIPILFYHTRDRMESLALVAVLFAQCAISTLWWDAFMMSSIFVSYGFYLRKISARKIFVVLAVGLFVVTIIQSLKHYQRAGGAVSKEVIVSLVNDFSNPAIRETLIEGVMGRLNQGIHDSFVYEKQNLVHFTSRPNTIASSFFGTFIPRFLYPEKPSFNSQKFIELGGYSGMGNSFISLSGVAEAFANFGLFGGCAFLFFFSLGLRLIWYRVVAIFQQPLILFLVLPFYHVLRIEVDFYHWFSAMIYGSVVLFLVCKISKTD